jgi:hypothetical protein
MKRREHILTWVKPLMEQLKHIFMVIRPYSLVDIVLLGVLGNVLASGILDITLDLTLDIFFAAIWWSTILLIVESRKNRDIPNIAVIFSSILLLAITAYRNSLAVFLICLDVLLLMWYSLKSKRQSIAVTSPIPRGLLSLTLLLIILLFHNALDMQSLSTNLSLLIAITLLIMARNIEGDIRDISVDKYSLAITLGKTKSRQLVISLVLLASILIFNITILPLLLLVLIMVFKPEEDSFHRIFVLTTMCFMATYISHMIGGSVLLPILLYIGFLLNFTYDSVPRTQSLMKKSLENPCGKLKEDITEEG